VKDKTLFPKEWKVHGEEKPKKKRNVGQEGRRYKRIKGAGRAALGGEKGAGEVSHL